MITPYSGDSRQSHHHPTSPGIRVGRQLVRMREAVSNKKKAGSNGTGLFWDAREPWRIRPPKLPQLCRATSQGIRRLVRRNSSSHDRGKREPNGRCRGGTSALAQWGLPCSRAFLALAKVERAFSDPDFPFSELARTVSLASLVLALRVVPFYAGSTAVRLGAWLRRLRKNA